MTSTDNNNQEFYSGLPLNTLPLSDLLADTALFSPIPQNWHVIITDIVGSTKATLGGRHQDVNLIATGSIVTVLNIAYGMNITVPFFFGGDGATFIIPPSLIDKVMYALTLYKTNILNNFNLELRTGTVPVTYIYDEGHQIHIAKFSSSASFSIPIVLGNGLNFAEQIIKGKDYLLSPPQAQQEVLDLSGMQCRWDTIAPPENTEEIVTLLVVATKVNEQARSFRKVLQKMDELYGTPEKRQPISVAKLKFKSTFSKLGVEMRARLGKIKWFELVRTWFLSLYGHIYFSTRSGKKYLKSMVEMSDTLVIDGKINTVISGTAKQRIALQKLLDAMENDGEILYGLNISGASVMSCYVRNLDDGHIHFVDGADGGYTMAAKVLKAKIKV
jgi:hypothetical protein